MPSILQFFASGLKSKEDIDFCLDIPLHLAETFGKKTN
jgi:hypothetical protein